MKKRETRYDKEKARLKVVLFCRSLLLLPSFEVGKNFKRLLCSSSSPFFAIMPRQQSAAAFMKSFQSSWLFSVKFENNTQTISSFMKFFNRLSLLFSKASLPPLAWLYNFEGNFSKEFSWKVVIQCGRTVLSSSQFFDSMTRHFNFLLLLPLLCFWNGFRVTEHCQHSFSISMLLVRCINTKKLVESLLAV